MKLGVVGKEANRDGNSELRENKKYPIPIVITPSYCIECQR